MDSTIYIAYGADAREMTVSLMERADVMRRIPPGASVALKPNMVVADAAENGATTHPGVIEGAMEYLTEHGIREISVIEGSWVGADTARAYAVTGIGRVAKRFGAQCHDLKRDSARELDTPAGKIRVCERALSADYLINLPVLKGHCQTTMTCALKNLKGCIPDAEKRRFHTMGLHRPIAALGTVLRPHLTIVDSICGDLNFEEGGTPIQTNRMMLGCDMVALDAMGCRLMGIDVSEVEYIGLAEAWGAGSARVGEIVEIGDPRSGGAFPRPSGRVARLSKGVTQRDACSACYGNLMHALYRLDEQGLLGYAPQIAIGQGMKGVAFDGLGIGRCCDCAARKVGGCPPRADQILDAIHEILH